jgi:RNA polymerase sigma-70 factor (ECF subfamily)
MTYLDMLPDTSESPSAALETGEERQIVRGIVDKMPDHLREVLELGYYQRFPYKEIADILGIPLGTVKSRLHAAVSHFANAYQRETQRRQEAEKQNRRSDSRRN